ncbi:OCIA domain-containing protein 1-like isoform X2 [Babylonia areolata]|uniref:OCIA domain-containing protein 1-like isoform X2 n=1 Tax=Babylonia areolata TaxID=304850 RepID=UPI003FD56506
MCVSSTLMLGALITSHQRMINLLLWSQSANPFTKDDERTTDVHLWNSHKLLSVIVECIRVVESPLNMESGGTPSSRPSQTTQGSPYIDPVSGNPHLPQPRLPRLTQEEIKILEECNTESFWYRCMPLGLAFGGATTFLVKAGHLKPHPRYGATLKALGAVFLGYVMGKISYQSVCQQKILEKIPHTNLAQSVRKSRGITSVYEQQPMADAGPENDSHSEKMRETYSSIDTSVDMTRWNVKELDDNMRPSLDREVKSREEEVAMDPQKTLTYDELRQRNRQEYERSMATSPQSPFRQRPFPGPQSLPSSAPAEPLPSPPPSSSSGFRPVWDAQAPESPGRAFSSSGGQKKNQYGDVWDNTN